MEDKYFNERKIMVKHHLKDRGIKNSKVLDAFLKVPRHDFVSEEYRDFSYRDHPLGIGHNQTISQPYIVAYMIDKLDVQKTDKVLEVGTGSGYQTAILAELAKTVYTLEVIKNLQDNAKEVLTKLGYKNIVYGQHSGYDGWEKYAPFDKIIVSAAAGFIPDKLIEQLNEGGSMIIPVGNQFSQRLYLIKKHNQKVEKEKLDFVRFVPMVKD